MSRSILLIFAHPDDESFGPSGTTIKYKELGVPTDLVCATRGEKGSRVDVPDGVGTGVAREAELRSAAAIIGIRDIYFLDYTDGELEAVNRDRVKRKVMKILRQVQPEVVITFGPDGVSGHADHIAIGKAATAAFNSLAGKAGGPRKLYYVTIPQSVLPNAEEIGITTRPDEEVTTAVDITKYLDLKIEAIAAHRSQQDARDYSETLSLLKGSGILINEYFYLASPEITGKETDLFT